MIGHDQLTDAQSKLQDGVRALVQPSTVTLARDADIELEQEAEVAHGEWMTRLRAKHAAARSRRDHAGMRRTLAAIVEREQAQELQRAARRSHTTQLPSLLDQLLDAVHPSQGGGGAGAGPHRAPADLGAAELLARIRRAVGARPEQDLAVRLRSWASLASHWRGSDPHQLLWAADQAEYWVSAAGNVLDPPRPLDLVAACPQCEARIVYVHDDAGELVRRPALQVDRITGTARCLAPSCSATWGPERLAFLAAVLEQQALDGQQAAA